MKRYGYIYAPGAIAGHTINSIYLTENTHGQRINEFQNKLLAENPDVFVSHKNEDQDIAEVVATTIVESGLKVYLDVWDPNIDDGPELVDYIESVIQCCNSLIAVVSPNTINSWWVPLEIGIAITRDLYLGTYLPSAYDMNIPSYLRKWPVLEDTYDLKSWCSEQEKATSPKKFYESLRENYSYMFG